MSRECKRGATTSFLIGRLTVNPGPAGYLLLGLRVLYSTAVLFIVVLLDLLLASRAKLRVMALKKLVLA